MSGSVREFFAKMRTGTVDNVEADEYVEALTARAKFGEISPEDLRAVGEELVKERPVISPTRLLYIMGRSEAREYRGAVELWLDRGDDMAAWEALLVLCTKWGETRKYRREVLRFIHGVPWDEDGLVRGKAMLSAANYLLENQDPELLEALLRILEDSNERVRDRRAAYVAVWIAMGRDFADAPHRGPFDPARDIDWSLVERAKERLRHEKMTGGAGA